MSLLALEDVSVRSRDGLRERVLLRSVSLELEAGELATVWGMRRSGRSTLLRVAAGVQPPSSGIVRFEGRSLAERGYGVLGDGIGFCRKALALADGATARSQLLAGPLACGLSPATAGECVLEALRRAGVEGCADVPLDDLTDVEAVRIAIARALVLRPRLLIVDEPTKGIDLAERDEILRLLRTLADEGLAVLASAGAATGLSGVDRALSLQDGELRAAPPAATAPVIPLRRSGGAGASR